MKKAISSAYPLTPMQNGMLYHKIVSNESSQYVLQTVVRIDGRLDIPAAKKAVQLLSVKHEVLKTAIRISNKTGRAWQLVIRDREIPIDVIDLSGIDIAEVSEEIDRIAKSDVADGFDLGRDSLIRVKLICVSEIEYRMIWCMHHIIVDGWCIGLLISDFLGFYARLCKGETEKSLKADAQNDVNSKYSDYLEWLSKQNEEDNLGYWNELLSEYSDVIGIKSSGNAYSEEEVNEAADTLSYDISASLERVASKLSVTMSTLLESAWGILLQRYNYTNDVVFLKVVSGRDANIRGIESIVGLFANAIPVRVKVAEDYSFADIIRAIQHQSLESMGHSFCPLVDIQKSIGMNDGLSETIFVYENYQNPDNLNEDITCGISLSVENAREQTNYPLSLSTAYADGKIIIKLLYDPGIYTAAESHLILSHYKAILEQFAKDPNMHVSKAAICSDEELKRINTVFNAESIKYTCDETISQRFEDTARLNSKRKAVADAETVLTYEQLYTQCCRFAKKLANEGVDCGDIVAIEATRSARTIVAILGTIMAGAAYLPIDHTYPSNRIDYIINDSKAKLLVAVGGELRHTSGIPVINAVIEKKSRYDGQKAIAEQSPESLAYVIYTSGTTGKPKGVRVKQRGVVNLAEVFRNSCRIVPEDNVLLFANLVFDASVSEWCMALLNGAQLIIPDKDTLTDPMTFGNYMKEKRISVVTLPPQFYMQVYDRFKTRVLITAGSEASTDVVRAASDCDIYINGYGPTEDTVCSTQWIHTKNENIPNLITIGKPVLNTRVHILNGMQCSGIGMIGELCVSGIGVADGYINQPELTSQKFVTNPFGKGLMYRTGDLACWQEDGNIRFWGRIDQQYKIRGFRIELSEIEMQIRRIEGISDVAVTVVNNSAICAYYISDRTFDVEYLTAKASELLPEYMVPTFFVKLDAIPTNRSGKVDVKALPYPIAILQSEREYPDTEAQKYVAALFRKINGMENVYNDSDFFHEGGDSIKLISMLSMMANDGYSLNARDIRNKRTVKGIAELINNLALGVDECNKFELTSFQLRLLSEGTRYTEDFLPLLIARKKGFDKELLEQALALVASGHDIFSMRVSDNLVELQAGSPKYNLDMVSLGNVGSFEQLCERIADYIRQLSTPTDINESFCLDAIYFSSAITDVLYLKIDPLLMDSVSDDILLREFTKAYDTLQNKKKTDFGHDRAVKWIDKFRSYWKSDRIYGDADYWNGVAENAQQLHSHIEDTASYGRSGKFRKRIKVESRLVPLLMNTSGLAYGADIEELLLCAVSGSIYNIYNDTDTAVSYNRSIRELFDEDDRFDSIVGKMDVLVPVVLTYSSSIEESLLGIQKQLRGVPNCGISYSFLRAENKCEEVRTDVSVKILKHEYDELSEAVHDSIIGMRAPDASYVKSTRIEFTVGKKEISICVESNVEEQCELLCANIVSELEKLAALCRSKLSYDEIISLSRADRAVAEAAINAALRGYEYKADNKKKTVRYVASSKQRSYIDTPQIMSTGIVVRGQYSAEDVQNALQELVREQSALRTAFMGSSFTEYESIGTMRCPVIDVSSLSVEAQQELVPLLNDICRQEQLYRHGGLSVKQLILYVNTLEYHVFAFADHILWDMESNQIWSRRIRSILDGGTKPDVITLSALAKSSDKLRSIRRFNNINKGFLNSSIQLGRKLGHDYRVAAIHRVVDTSKCGSKILSNPLSVAMRLVFENIACSLKNGGAVSEIPVFLVFRNRSERNMNTLGFFADILPIVVSTEEGGIERALDYVKSVMDTGKLMPETGRLLRSILAKCTMEVPVINISSQYDTNWDDYNAAKIVDLYERQLDKTKRHHSMDVHILLGSEKLMISMMVLEENRKQMEEHLNKEIAANCDEQRNPTYQTRRKSNMPNVIIKLENVCKTFYKGKRELDILKNLNIDIYEKDFTIIMGASGAGKSTFLYVCSGMDKPTSGSIVFCGEDISDYSSDQLALFRRKHCGFVFQQMYLNNKMSVLDNILVNGYLSGRKRSEIVNNALDLLSNVGLDPVLYDKFPTQLSGGEAQRVAIARAQINSPEIVFADEPTGALNFHSSCDVLDFFSDMNRNGQSVVMVTHDIRTAVRGNRILYLRDGVILDELNLKSYRKEDEPERFAEVQSFLNKMGW